MRRWTDLVAAAAALVLAIGLALEVRGLDVWVWALVAALAAAPLATYVALTQARAYRWERVALTVVLVAEVALYTDALTTYDRYTLGGVLFFVVPFYGVLALLLTLVVFVAGRAVARRHRHAGPPTSAAAGRP